ncbi:DNA-binding transcriptional MerR regulator [Natranaerovirga pectinivora]|uniref:DNA-binding transcriptional MerR regulator n=1 Tax=Natranaerovirga pectinivora TaxID=682400 RepID=A0A4R3MTK0_9FIRM|nr:MerR family transcriptional regulator [Natranaerovirga pectinivora]TCT17040.1 DNA-binding transcriptional MerR regulator [Natranaerovirga pectinivora]
MKYTIAQVSERTGLTPHTLRYYDKEGLLPFIERSASGIRIFKESDFEWLSLISCLKNTGMQIKDIKQFIDWCSEGDSTLQNRLELFKLQKEQVNKQIEALNKHLEKINHKIEYYELACEAGTEKAVKKASSL